MYTSSMNNPDKFRFVGAPAKQSIYDTQLPSQPRIGESAITMPADPKRKKFGSYEFLTLKDPRVCKTITLLNKYYDIKFFNNSFKSSR